MVVIHQSSNDGVKGLLPTSAGFPFLLFGQCVFYVLILSYKRAFVCSLIARKNRTANIIVNKMDIPNVIYM